MHPSTTVSAPLVVHPADAFSRPARFALVVILAALSAGAAAGAFGCTAKVEHPPVLRVAPNGGGLVQGPANDDVDAGAAGTSAPEVEIATGLSPASVQIARSYVYWVDLGGAERLGSIQRAAMPTGAPEVLAREIPGPRAIAVTASGAIFVAIFGNAKTPGGVYRLEGAQLAPVSTTSDDLEPDALVASGADLYWLAQGGGGVALRRKPANAAATTIAAQPSGSYGEHSLAIAGGFVFAALTSASGGVIVRAPLSATNAVGEAVANLASGFGDLVEGPNRDLLATTTGGIARLELASNTVTVPWKGLGNPVALRREGQNLVFVGAAPPQLLRLSTVVNTAPIVLWERAAQVQSIALSPYGAYLARPNALTLVRY
jgi:hypothetical protein